MSKRKGSSFEREFCTKLSLWWSGGKRDDVFWRSAGSGARATARGKRGRATAGQYGDVAATHPKGQILIDLLTIELKRGYASCTLHDCLDRHSRHGIQELEAFFDQAITSHRQAGSLAWMLVTRRDRRAEWIWIPNYLLKYLRDVGAFASPPAPSVSCRVEVRNSKGAAWHTVFGTTAENFFAGATPHHFRELAKIS